MDVAVAVEVITVYGVQIIELEQESIGVTSSRLAEVRASRLFQRTLEVTFVFLLHHPVPRRQNKQGWN